MRNSYRDLGRLQKKNEEYIRDYVIPSKQRKLIPVEKYREINNALFQELYQSIEEQRDYIKILEARSNHLEGIFNNRLYKIYKKVKNLISR